jgi:hypothetical protein
MVYGCSYRISRKKNQKKVIEADDHSEFPVENNLKHDLTTNLSTLRFSAKISGLSISAFILCCTFLSFFVHITENSQKQWLKKMQLWSKRFMDLFASLFFRSGL